MEACLRRTVIDRPPVALWRHFPVDDQSPVSLAEAHIAYQGLYDFDLLKVTPASSFSVRDWGVEDVWEGSPEGTRTYTKRAIGKPGDWLGLPVLDPDSGYLAQQLECLALIRERLGQEIPVLQTVFSPLAQAKHLAGEETLLGQLRENADAVMRGLETIGESTRLFIQAASGKGIDGIFYAVQHAQSRLLTREEFMRFSRGADLAALQSAAGLWCNVLHVHGENIFFDAISDYQAQIVNWHDRDTGPDLHKASRTWPGALCGGLRMNTLVYGTADEVSREAREAFAVADAGRLILSTGCVVPIIAPHGNIRAARHAADSSSTGTH